MRFPAYIPIAVSSHTGPETPKSEQARIFRKKVRTPTAAGCRI